MDSRFPLNSKLVIFIVAFFLGAIAASYRVTATPIAPKQALVLPGPILLPPRQDAQAPLNPIQEGTAPIALKPTPSETSRQKVDPRAIEKAIVELKPGPVGKTKVHHEHGNEQITLKPGENTNEAVKKFTSLPPKAPDNSRLSNLRPVVRI